MELASNRPATEVGWSLYEKCCALTGMTKSDSRSTTQLWEPAVTASQRGLGSPGKIRECARTTPSHRPHFYLEIDSFTFPNFCRSAVRRRIYCPNLETSWHTTKILISLLFSMQRLVNRIPEYNNICMQLILPEKRIGNMRFLTLSKIWKVDQTNFHEIILSKMALYSGI